jgi:hypothetical protein
LSLLAACSPAKPPLGVAITAPQSAWTWVDFPDSACNDGSTTGIGISPTTSTKLVIFLEGGGACGDYATCYVNHFATLGPYQQADFTAQLSANSPLGSGSIFDRTDPNNPFADWNMVYVPYCTGDLHGGTNVVEYDQPGSPSMMFHHVGHSNIIAYMKRLGATYPSLDKLVLSGSSAGGYGTILNYDTVQPYFQAKESYLLDDSGPPLQGFDVPTLIKDWFAPWGLTAWITQGCATCADEVSDVVPFNAMRHPSDRMGLLSSEQDKTIRSYLTLTATDFQAGLLSLASQVLDPQPRWKYFFVTGDTHTMLRDPKDFTTNGTVLWTWLTQLVTDDAAWTSVQP